MLLDTCSKLMNAELVLYTHKIIEEGIEAGIFNTSYPEEAAELYIYIVNILKNSVLKLICDDKRPGSTQKMLIKRKVKFYEETLNRMLGAGEKGIKFAKEYLVYFDSVSGLNF